jgi:nucleotide-binding universal stress UspA family protein
LGIEVRHLRRSLPKKVGIEPMVMAGAVAKEVGELSRGAKAELIVMGRGGGRGIRDAFLGSTAERVIRQAHLPVLVVRQRPRVGYRRPCLALALDHAAEPVLRVMLRVLPPPRPQVVIVHAYDIPYQGLIYPSLSGDQGAETREELQEEAAEEVARLLADADLPLRDVPPWKMHVRYGSPRMVVEKAMKKYDTDLLVLGTRGYSGAAYAFMGTVAGRLLRAATCDVLVVPPTPAPK